MAALKKAVQNEVEYIGLQTNNKEYLLSHNPKTNVMSLFSGTGLFKKFQDLLDCQFDGCIECNLTLAITEAISKEADVVTELGISKKEANQVIGVINTHLNIKYPIF